MSTTITTPFYTLTVYDAKRSDKDKDKDKDKKDPTDEELYEQRQALIKEKELYEKRTKEYEIYQNEMYEMSQKQKLVKWKDLLHNTWQKNNKKHKYDDNFNKDLFEMFIAALPLLQFGKCTNEYDSSEFNEIKEQLNDLTNRHWNDDVGYSSIEDDFTETFENFMYNRTEKYKDELLRAPDLFSDDDNF
jgi:hypothetical protein